MNPGTDKRTVLTLDAGGTNLVFTAIRGNQDITEPVTLPSRGDQLNTCIDSIEEGFRALMKRIDDKPAAISFAFPGPSDYRTGVIGKLNNLPAFTGGIPLGPILQHRFSLPVFINNDGDLYAYGEALSGFLPEVNALLEQKGVNRRFRNLIGLTLGTGFGGGLVINEQLLTGDNSMAGEVWLFRNRLNPETNAEEGISIRAVQRVYYVKTGMENSEALTPRDIFDIASGKKEGNSSAAIEAFSQLGTILGDVLGNLLTVFDSAVVIGGGLSGAMSLIFPALMQEIKAAYKAYSGSAYPRLVQKVFNMSDPVDRAEFLNWEKTEIAVPGSGEKIAYHGEARIPLGLSSIGTSRAISLGAYAYALKQLDQM